MANTDWFIDGDSQAEWTLILAHGAGQGAHSDFMLFFGHALAEAGLRVIRFEFPFMQQMERSGRRRPPDREPVLKASWIHTVETVLDGGADVSRLLIGGKSMGGRMASMVAEQSGAAGLICLGYPFHPPGNPGKLRTEHLLSLSVPTLICQGTRDPFGCLNQVMEYGLSPSINITWIEDGEHSFKPRKQSGRTLEQNLQQAADAVVAFTEGLTTEKSARGS